MSALSIAWLEDREDDFPPVESALDRRSEAPGLLAAGGDLRPSRLRRAYAHGIFPWYSLGQPILWWSPDPRMVLYPAEFRISRSLRKTLQRFIARPDCTVRVDTAFDQVIVACATTPRHGQEGTWIVPEMMQAYRAWHRLGEVHSFETWIDGQLCGGLYGVAIGRMFFGESMFSRQTDASKIALAALVAFCRHHGIDMIDCQQRTAHLASLGAREIPRRLFTRHLHEATGLPPVEDWTYHRSMWTELGLVPSPPHPSLV
ncbi:leucyl/phenylalanyl-tRNA--protein transferase [Caldimonas thermodepolymerans]|uniref:Leucyl/phenylalanyl-tRNA--protein transferase n=1 Tax=Caldimonas thermodepolymerans TaxID=215580 RepID=A0AA46DBR1_9BURK|nr:leucyl/phenylalanyl-tRNA--protein transferase [Caldimonas thermodepolymerans]TCP03709.1 leucyl/phenylalanyl-tRNA--protein transferase [Caldimonas thermodepolymerans]UZG46764.1 leucyl/phenylalanyl-tRNA--protein transferase [Caldimonas thermodepolymerans]